MAVERRTRFAIVHVGLSCRFDMGQADRIEARVIREI
jgi:hypothetical protein